MTPTRPIPRCAPTLGSASSVSSDPYTNCLGYTGCTNARIHDSDSPDPMACTVAKIHELCLARYLKIKLPRLRNDALVDDSVSTKKHAHTCPLKKPPGDPTRISRGLGGYTRGCARAHPLSRQKSPDNSTRIAQGLLSGS